MSTRCFNDKTRMCQGENNHSDTPCALYDAANGHCVLSPSLWSLRSTYEALAGEAFDFSTIAIEGTRECFMDKNYKNCGIEGQTAENVATCDYWMTTEQTCLYKAYYALITAILSEIPN